MSSHGKILEIGYSGDIILLFPLCYINESASESSEVIKFHVLSSINLKTIAA